MSTAITSEAVKPIAICFRQTGDPWHDWGLCELYDLLRTVALRDARLKVLSPDIAGFSINTVMSADELAALLHSEMASSQRWNDLHPRFEEGKKITPECGPRYENGRRVTGEKNDAKFVRDNWQIRGCKGNAPQQARNKCQRITNVPLTPTVLRNLLNIEGGAKSFAELVKAAIIGDNGDLKQEANPLTANHHSNGKVRGPSASNSSRVEEGVLLLSCYCASLSPWKPFATVPPSSCTVYLPDNVPFERALRLWNFLRRGPALRHPDDEGGQMYRNLKIAGDGEEAQLLILLDALQSELPVTRSSYSDDLNADDIREINNWIAISFSSGTGVAVGSVHRIEVPGELFHLLEPIAPPSYFKNQTDVSFVRDCLSGVRVEGVPIQSRIARALLRTSPSDRWRGLENAMFVLCREVTRARKSNRYCVSLLPHFMHHFAKEMKIFMQEDQLEACRKIGQLAGRAFSSDVTMLSRLHNSTSPEDLRTNLSLLAFRLFKASNDPDNRAELHRIKTEEFQKVLDLSHGTNWQAAAQTISLFACLTAFNNNLGDSENAQPSVQKTGGSN